MKTPIYNQDGYLNPEWAIQPTTWAYCWRCGKKINPEHTEAIKTGVHNNCATQSYITYPDDNSQTVLLRIGSGA